MFILMYTSPKFIFKGDAVIKQLKFDFFQVVMPQDSRLVFTAILRQINALQGVNRVDENGDYHARLQSLNQSPSDFLGDIARIRMNDIPNKMKLSGETEPLELDADEGLGEIASFIYHPATNILMMMRNRNAVSISGLCHYIENKTLLQGLQFKHVLQPDVYQRLERLVRIQRLNLEVADLGNGTIFQDLGLAPEAAVDLMGVSPRVRLSLVFSTGYDKDHSLPREMIEAIVSAFRARVQQPNTESMSLVVSGREENYEKEVIDLFEDVLTDYQDVNIRNQRTITDAQRHDATRAVWARNRERLIRLFGQ